MVDVVISASDDLSGQPQDTDLVLIIRDGTTVFSQSWADFKEGVLAGRATVRSGTADPDDATGVDGDVYLKHS